MAKLVFSDVSLWLGTQSLKNNINEIQLATEAEDVDVSNMGSGGWKESLAGLVKGGLSYAGFFEAAEPDAYLSGQHTLSDVPVTVGPEGGDDGEVSFITKPLMLSYVRGAAVGEAFKINVAGPTVTPIVRATVLGNATYTTTTNGTAREIGAALATQTIYTALHVTGASAGDTLNVTIESDATNSFSGSETTRFTFTQIAGGTESSEWKTLVGAVTDTWWRAVFTVAGDGSESFDAVISLGVK